MEQQYKRCNHEKHEGKRYLPVEEFHKQGRRNGRQYYKGICKKCANRDFREAYAEGKRKNEWSRKQEYVRARSRALTRLSKLAPELYRRCLEEELLKEFGWDEAAIRKLMDSPRSNLRRV